MEEKVSIIIPVYNAEKYIKETVESVLQQSYKNWELILVENGSSDRTGEILSELTDERIRVIFAGDNVGAARARNLGMEVASGRYAGFLDADDLWMPQKLSEQIAFMKDKNAGFCFTGYEFGDESAKGTGKVVRVPETITYRKALGNTTIFTSTVLFDTSVLPKEKLMMPDVKSEDSALWFQILREGVTAYGLDRNLVIYRRPGKSLSSNKFEAMKRIWNLYRRQEKLNVFVSSFYFVQWAARAVLRRI